MSIKHFSKEEIINVVKDILKHNKLFGIRDADKLSPTDSLREVLDFSSLEIAELLVTLEEKYHIDMDWVLTGNVDTLNDIYNVFVATIAKTRQSAMTINANQIQK